MFDMSPSPAKCLLVGACPVTALMQSQVDFLPQQDPIAYSQLLHQAETFIRERLLPKLRDVQPEPSVHIVKVGWHLLSGQPLVDAAQCVYLAANEQLVKRSVCNPKDKKLHLLVAVRHGHRQHWQRAVQAG